MGEIPKITFVDKIYIIAAPIVPPITAIGTFFLGFSTASLLAAADSRPKKAHSVIEIELPIPSIKL